MRLYKCIARFCGGTFALTKATIDIDKIDSICSTSNSNYSDYNYVYEYGTTHIMITNEDREKIERLLESKFVNNE